MQQPNIVNLSIDVGKMINRLFNGLRELGLMKIAQLAGYYYGLRRVH